MYKIHDTHVHLHVFHHTVKNIYNYNNIIYTCTCTHSHIPSACTGTKHLLLPFALAN